MLYSNPKFYKEIQKLRRNLKPGDITENTKLIIDISHHFHAIFGTDTQMGRRHVKVDANSVGKYAVEWANKIIKYLDCLELPSMKYIFVIEDKSGVGKPNYPESEKKKNNKAHLLNQGLRGAFLGLQTEINPGKLLGRAIGRPDWWLTLMIADELRKLDYPVYGRPNAEADQIIAEIAVSIPDDYVVVGSDMDLLALTTGIRGMVSPQNRNRGIFLEKSDILKEYDLTERELFIVFALSNSTNLVPLWDNSTFHSILDVCSCYPEIVESADLSCLGDSDEIAQVTASLNDLISRRFTPLAPKDLPEIKESPEISIPDTLPLWRDFSSEMKANSTLRRASLKQKLETHFDGTGARATSSNNVPNSKTNKQDWLQRKIDQSKVISRTAIKKKSYTYSNFFQPLMDELKVEEFVDKEEMPEETVKMLKYFKLFVLS